MTAGAARAAWGIGCLLAGLAAGGSAVAVFNRLPARWLCDWGETPGPELSGTRASFRRQGPALGAACAAAFYLFHLQYPASSASYYLLCLAVPPLALCALSDLKYGILPDQCLPAVLLPAAANLILGLSGGAGGFYGSPASPFLGALCGGGLWALLGLAGRLAAGRESVGPGDVKLAAALGFLCGLPLTPAVFLLTILTAGLHFSVLLLRKRIRGDQGMPMGPYLCASCALALAFRSQIFAGVRWYASTFFLSI